MEIPLNGTCAVQYSFDASLLACSGAHVSGTELRLLHALQCSTHTMMKQSLIRKLCNPSACVVYTQFRRTRPCKPCSAASAAHHHHELTFDTLAVLASCAIRLLASPTYLTLCRTPTSGAELPHCPSKIQSFPSCATQNALNSYLDAVGTKWSGQVSRSPLEHVNRTAVLQVACAATEMAVMVADSPGACHEVHLSSV